MPVVDIDTAAEWMREYVLDIANDLYKEETGNDMFDNELIIENFKLAMQQ